MSIIDKVPAGVRLSMIAAYRQATQSADPSTQQGAIALRHGRIVGQGCNAFPAGIAETPERLADRPLKLEMVVHAEVAAVLDAFRRGEAPDELVAAIPACANCAKHLIASGVRRVIGPLWHMRAFSEVNPAWNESRKLSMSMLVEAGVEVEWADGAFSAPQVRMSGQLYNPETGRCIANA